MKNLARQVLIKLTNEFLVHVIEPLMQWVINDDDKQNFFFIVIGTENVVDVAFANTEKLFSDGAMQIALYPETAACFEGMKVTYDLMLEESRKDPEFEKKFRDLDLMDIDKECERHWFSDDLAQPGEDGIM